MIEKPTVYVIDDDDAVRKSICWLLESIKLNVKDYASAEDFLDDYTMFKTGCILLDIRMPGMSGLQLQKELNKNKFIMPIIMVTGHGDVPMAVQSMRDGALDFIEKPFNDQRLLDLIKIALDLDTENLKRRLENDAVIARLNNLTRREKEVLMLIAQELPNKTIANKLALSVKTVEYHRSHLMEKMHVKKVTQLLKLLSDNEIVFE
ncbi:MAG: DNA-binding response regulator [uncultured Thiotrichaceae bacterium]|uniref:DNA-binding response regulator n=1 Tax=uncultured Thiotrichaceae bacterium TaxID=298394 RepID=A0A6S6U6J0_9GAMM|nr:MAG: DNA-binding response regulator [uncultured Thiotrichaceae bacterium]